MAKKIKQAQIEGQIVNSVVGTGVDNTDPKNPIINHTPTIVSVEITGTTTKTVKINFSDSTSISGQFTDLNTEYDLITESQLSVGTDTTKKVVSAKVLVDYLNSRLSSVMTYKGQKTNYTELPASGNKTGDTWNIVNAYPTKEVKAGDNVCWNGADWDVLSGTIDTSMFLTEEVDPTGLKSIAVTGTGTKTITVTLNNNTTKTAQFTDIDTTYTLGTLSHLNTGTDTTGRLWRAKDLSDWLSGKNFLTTANLLKNKNDFFGVLAGNIVSGKVNLMLSETPVNAISVFVNGVKVLNSSFTITGMALQITQSLLATPIEVSDEIEVFYQY
ncbi:MAG: hypothetical protein WCY77_10330 [Weeksellaceae bacterium]